MPHPTLRLLDLAIGGLSRHLQQYVFGRLASRLGVTRVTHRGELGQFDGDPRDRAVFAHLLGSGSYAPGLQHLLQHLFSARQGALIDVGANIGLTSVPVARSRGVACYCFEPDPGNFRLLTANVAANEVGGLVSPFNVALMSEEGVFELEQSGDNMGDHRIRLREAAATTRELHGESRRAVVEVAARRLDEVLAAVELQEPVVLKVDTQGGEVRVLDGASGIIDRVDVLIVEYTPYLLRRMGDSPDALLEQLRRFPFGAILDDTAASLPQLISTTDLIDGVRRRPGLDGRSDSHLDLILSRRPRF